MTDQIAGLESGGPTQLHASAIDLQVIRFPGPPFSAAPYNYALDNLLLKIYVMLICIKIA